MQPKFLNLMELAEVLRVSGWTIMKWRDAGIIPCIHIGHVNRYELDKVLDALREETKKRLEVKNKG